MFLVVSPYKDPVENQHMKKYFDKIITGFFVFIFGILWFCSAKYYVKPKTLDITVYDLLGKESNSLGIRTHFKNPEVAVSYLKEYQKLFPHLEFSIRYSFPEFKKRVSIAKIFKIIYR